MRTIDCQGAIFDLDGTLLDSMHIWDKLDLDFLHNRQLPVPDKYLDTLACMTFKEAAEYIINIFGLEETPEDLQREWNRMALEEYRYNIFLKPYVKEYLLTLKSLHIKTAVATALPPELFEPVLKNNKIYELFDAFVWAGEVKRGKEFPDLYILASAKLALAPEKCIVFEDALLAVKGVRAAGMKVCGVYDWKAAADKEQFKAEADFYIEDFFQLINTDPR